MAEQISTSRLSGLPGTARDVDAVNVSTPTGASRWPFKGRAVTAAGSTGALNVWRDDQGAIRCEFMRNMVTLDSATFDTITKAKRWMRRWWPQLQGCR